MALANTATTLGQHLYDGLTGSGFRMLGHHMEPEKPLEPSCPGDGIELTYWWTSMFVANQGVSELCPDPAVSLTIRATGCWGPVYEKALDVVVPPDPALVHDWSVFYATLAEHGWIHLMGLCCDQQAVTGLRCGLARIQVTSVSPWGPIGQAAGVDWILRLEIDPTLAPVSPV